MTESLSVSLEKSEKLVVDLRDATRKIIHMVGGKAASLGELLEHGLPVPPGFVVTTRAYDLFVEKNGLKSVIENFSGANQAAILRRLILEGEVPREVVEAIREAYYSRGDGRVAVRSSATVEDLPEAAFAGQHDTFLNVEGIDRVVEAVKKCWASLWSDRAVAYRESLGVSHSKAKMAVIVQRMVDADVSGVMFTANPVTGVREEVVVNAFRGLGESIVSGVVTPDHYVLVKTRFGWKIVEKRISGDKPVLDDRTLVRLASIGARIQRLFGTPQDIEWALEKGRIYILQSRPITSLPEPPPKVGRLKRSLLLMLAEFLPERPYPLEIAWIDAVFSNAVGRVASYYGVRLPSVSDLIEEDDDGVPVRINPYFRIGVSPSIILAPARLLINTLRYNAIRWRNDSDLEEFNKRFHMLDSRLKDVSEWREIVDIVDGILYNTVFIGELRRKYLPSAVLSAVVLRIWLSLMGKGEMFPKLMFSCLDTKVSEANRQLERLASLVKSNGELFRIFVQEEPTNILDVIKSSRKFEFFYRELQKFLAEYGHREASGSLLLSRGSWVEKPELVIGIVKSLLTIRKTADEDSSCHRFEETLNSLFSTRLLRFIWLERCFSGFYIMLGSSIGLGRIHVSTL
ncbi:PEP/pyruvate-binding domain-containing protein [Aeropyrum pernix]|uniref:PEP/pyruvate-binding domain-containing protein n=1 Tax=Aeropyrum pernix TaxID=56636 RepID=UPI000AAE612E|nr:PEP/pyruvate-binding domain-containing protein [Aeropyrum pernix]